MLLRLVTVNINFRHPENRVNLRPLAESLSPDLMVLVESLPGDAQGLADLYPHRAVHEDPVRIWEGLSLLSRYPVCEREVLLPGTFLPILRAVVDAPQGPLEVYAVHLVPTMFDAGLGMFFTSFPRRRAQFRLLEERGGRQVSASLIAGDFNVTPWMPDLRRLRRRYRDALAELGADAPTYRFFVPLRLDYVLTRGLRPVAGRTLETPWTDHQGLLLDFDMREPGGPPEKD